MMDLNKNWKEVIKYDDSSLTECDSFNNNKPSNKKGLIKMSNSQNDTRVINEVVEEVEIELTIDEHILVESHLTTLINSLIEENSLLKMSSKEGRKSQVLEILVHQGPISIVKIAEQLEISTKNVSSQLTYLRSDGEKICTDHNGLKFIIE